MSTRKDGSGMEKAIDRFLGVGAGAAAKGGESPGLVDSDQSPAFDLARLPVLWANGVAAGARFKSPTFIITFGTQTFRSIDWSLGGLRCEGFFGVAQVGTEAKVAVQDARYRFGAVVRVFWISRSAKQFVLQFTQIQAETVNHLKQLAQVNMKNK
jgi:hypothetical protein